MRSQPSFSTKEERGKTHERAFLLTQKRRKHRGSAAMNNAPQGFVFIYSHLSSIRTEKSKVTLLLHALASFKRPLQT